MDSKAGKLTEYINSLRDYFNKTKKSKTFQFGIPFVLFVVGGSFGLREFAQIRYSFSQVKGVTREEAEAMGLNKAKDVTLEDAYEDIKKIDIDNWENKRGPRPWEMNQQQNKK